MNEIKIYLKTSGSIAELYKDFSLYQGSYQNVLLSLYVPKSLLYANEQNTFGNAIKTGGILTAPNGKKITTESYYADYVKDETKNEVEYAVYSQKLPKEYVVYSGTQTIVANVVSIDTTDENNPVILEVTTSQTAQLVVQESAYLSKEEIITPDVAETLNAKISALQEGKQDKLTAGAGISVNAFANADTIAIDFTQTLTEDTSKIAPNGVIKEYVDNEVATEKSRAETVENEIKAEVAKKADTALLANFNKQLKLANGTKISETVLSTMPKVPNEDALITAKGIRDFVADNAFVSDAEYPNLTVGKAVNDGAGNNIETQFSSINSDIDGIREDIKNEAHFRGYLSTNAEIEALSGTPNDYAYSAESGTVWIYQEVTGWTNSEKPVPDQTTPASSATPLMDGTASVGTSEEYARGDHRHPSDTAKANKSGEAFTGGISAPTVTGSNGVYDGSARVYSSNNPPPTGAVASDNIPLMDGSATAGVDGGYSRSDHRHPSDSTKADLTGQNAITVVSSTNLSTKLKHDGVSVTNSMYQRTWTYGDSSISMNGQNGVYTLGLPQKNGIIAVTSDLNSKADKTGTDNITVVNNLTTQSNKTTISPSNVAVANSITRAEYKPNGIDVYNNDVIFARYTYPAGTGDLVTSAKLSEQLSNMVSGVKGSAETTYRKGNVNLTAANIGAQAELTPTQLTAVNSGITKDLVTKLNGLENYVTQYNASSSLGIMQFSNGFTIQWGRDTRTTNNRFITFNQSFSTTPYSVQVNFEYSAKTTNGWGYAYNIANNGFNVVADVAVDWVAFGYKA